MNQSALKALLAGPEMWAKYRISLAAGVAPDLNGAKLAHVNLRRRDLSGAKLVEADLTGADLSGAKLVEADLTGAKLNATILSGARIDEAILIRAELIGAKLDQAVLIGATLDHANLTGANLLGATLNHARLTGAELTEADLTGAYLISAKLNHAVFARADLNRAELNNSNLTGSTLTDANLTNADLTGAKLTFAKLTGAKFTGAKLIRAEFNRANLTAANFGRANLTDANLTDAHLAGTGFLSANLTRANLAGTELATAEINGKTIDFGGHPLWSNLLPFTHDSDLEPGVVRIQVDLPPGAEPQVLADYMESVAVMAHLISRVGTWLQHDWFGDPQPEVSGNVLTAIASESTVINVRRAHYGSPWWVELYEFSNSVGPVVGHGAGLGAGLGGTAIALGKYGKQIGSGCGKLLDFFTKLARKSERDAFFAARDEAARTVLESRRADTAREVERRSKHEQTIIPLRIEPGSQADFERRIASAVTDPKTLATFSEFLRGMMPLLKDGFTVLSPLEEGSEQDNENPAIDD